MANQISINVKTLKKQSISQKNINLPKLTQEETENYNHLTKFNCL